MRMQWPFARLHPLRIVAVRRPDRFVAPIVAALRRLPDNEIVEIEDLAELGTPSAARAHMVVIWHQVLAKWHDEKAELFERLMQRAKVVALVTSDRVLESAAALRLADAWLLTDVAEAHIEGAIVLAQQGYSILPADLGEALARDRRRVEIAARLPETERRILGELSTGRTNREIAARLAVREAEAKMLVRALLRHLRFTNRTEAAVFAVRMQAASERYRRSQRRHLSHQSS